MPTRETLLAGLTALHREHGPVENVKTAAAYFSSLKRNDQALGTKFVKVAQLQGLDPWKLAFQIANAYPEVEKSASFGMPLSKFYVEWAKELEKTALVREIGGGIKGALGALRSTFSAGRQAGGVSGGIANVLQGGGEAASGFRSGVGAVKAERAGAQEFARQMEHQGPIFRQTVPEPVKMAPAPVNLPPPPPPPPRKAPGPGKGSKAARRAANPPQPQPMTPPAGAPAQTPTVATPGGAPVAGQPAAQRARVEANIAQSQAARKAHGGDITAGIGKLEAAEEAAGKSKGLIPERAKQYMAGGAVLAGTGLGANWLGQQAGQQRAVEAMQGGYPYGVQ